MKIRAKYLLAFLSSTLLTLVIIGVTWMGLVELEKTTNYLVDKNNQILEFASLFEKELAQSRRAEKEFFIFPDDPAKQAKYVSDWEKMYKNVRNDALKLQDLFESIDNQEMAKKMRDTLKLIKDNEQEFELVVHKFQETKSYDAVNAAEYGSFKEKTHAIEEAAKAASSYGLAEVTKGRQSLVAVQHKVITVMQILALVSIVWGIVLPLVLATRMTSAIINLTKISDAVSMGNLDQEINIERKDELGDLARAIKRMQKSFVLMISRLPKKN
ncbi:MAG: HAMP domain-containing protein [Desulfoarculaceae bacterium]|nr:HAMP domain-containing protein [Desulfoarculaceae bacterium]